MLRQIQKWSIHTVKEFGEFITKSKWILYKDETIPVVEMDITELRKLKEFFDNWIDPFDKNNPNHNDKLI